MDRLPLLPSGATDFEVALSTTLDRLPELFPGVDTLTGFKVVPPILDVVLPHLIAEYGLSDVALYVDDLRQVITEGIVFERRRGTLAAIHQALGWVGRDGAIEEQPPQRVKWWWFQLHLPDEVRSSEFAPVVSGVVDAAKPVRSQLARITAGYDKRAFMLNGSRLNGGALLNSWSGVRRSPDGPVLSLRTHLNLVTAVEANGVGVMHTDRHRRTYVTDASAATVTRSSLFVGSSTVSIGWSRNVPFQNAPFTDGVFEAPSPRIQKGY